LFKSLLLNSLSVTSIYTYDIFLHPLVKDQEKWLHRNLGRFYQVLWLLPVIGISFYLNVRPTQLPENRACADTCLQMSWCSVIAKRTFILHYGSRAVAQPPRTYSNFLNQLATSAYRVVMIFTSAVVSYGLKQIPYVGSGLEFTFLCWVDS
jgi:etoposide-induced 2.4 mRNA